MYLTLVTNDVSPLMRHVGGLLQISVQLDQVLFTVWIMIFHLHHWTRIMLCFSLCALISSTTKCLKTSVKTSIWDRVRVSRLIRLVSDYGSVIEAVIWFMYSRLHLRPAEGHAVSGEAVRVRKLDLFPFQSLRKRHQGETGKLIWNSKEFYVYEKTAAFIWANHYGIIMQKL